MSTQATAPPFIMRPIGQNLDFSEGNFSTLLTNLKGSTKLSLKAITKMAGYSGDNASRDYGTMMKAATNKKREKWTKLVQALPAYGLSLQELLKKAV